MMAQPGNRQPAPDGPALVQDFVNSVNVEFGPDEFATPDGLIAWMAHHGLDTPGPPLDDFDLLSVTAVREALRALLRENNGAAQDPNAYRTLEHLGRDCPLVVGWGRRATPGLVLRPAFADVRGVVGAVLAAVVTAMADGSWSRLKACQEPRCEWAFYDRSRNRASRWCSMAGCGTRDKMRTYRQGGVRRKG